MHYLPRNCINYPKNISVENKLKNDKMMVGVSAAVYLSPPSKWVGA
jgi:hypothetical protein